MPIITSNPQFFLSEAIASRVYKTSSEFTTTNCKTKSLHVAIADPGSGIHYKILGRVDGVAANIELATATVITTSYNYLHNFVQGIDYMSVTVKKTLTATSVSGFNAVAYLGEHF
jgi:hypothetical protein